MTHLIQTFRDTKFHVHKQIKANPDKTEFILIG